MVDRFHCVVAPPLFTVIVEPSISKVRVLELVERKVPAVKLKPAVSSVPLVKVVVLDDKKASARVYVPPTAKNSALTNDLPADVIVWLDLPLKNIVLIPKFTDIPEMSVKLP